LPIFVYESGNHGHFSSFSQVLHYKFVIVMTMTFSLRENIDPNGAFDRIDPSAFQQNGIGETVGEEFHILRDKLKVPETEGIMDRPRINALLGKSLSQFPATLISGRAGAGKTALAANFAARNENVSWYSVESTDVEWTIFARYFSASLPETVFGDLSKGMTDGTVSQTEIARFLVNRFSLAYAGPNLGPSLIVLDDIHHIFDAAWFEDFFTLLLYSLPPDTRLLLLCRSKPPGPLWRLRSKQMLDFIDEKIIAFNAAETEILFEKLGLPVSTAREAHRHCFGRVSKLLKFAADISTILPPSPSGNE
jgi:hypothetical protein